MSFLTGSALAIALLVAGAGAGAHAAPPPGRGAALRAGAAGPADAAGGAAPQPAGGSRALRGARAGGGLAWRCSAPRRSSTARASPSRAGRALRWRWRIVLDDSLSMRARLPGGATRWARALAAARELTDGLAGGDEVAIVLAGAPARVALGSTTNMAAVAEALDGLAPSDRATDLDGAVQLARGLLRGLAQRDKRVVVLSDLADGSSPEAPPLRRRRGDRALGARARARGQRAGLRGDARGSRRQQGVGARGLHQHRLAANGRGCGGRRGGSGHGGAGAFGGAIAGDPLGRQGDRVGGAGPGDPQRGGGRRAASGQGGALCGRGRGRGGGPGAGRAARGPHGQRRHRRGRRGAGGGGGRRAADGGGGRHRGRRTWPRAGRRPSSRRWRRWSSTLRSTRCRRCRSTRRSSTPWRRSCSTTSPGFTPAVRRALAAWVERGGVLLLTLGPRAAAAPLGASFDPLVPGVVRWGPSPSPGVDPATAALFGPSAEGMADLAPRGPRLRSIPRPPRAPTSSPAGRTAPRCWCAARSAAARCWC